MNPRQLVNPIALHNSVVSIGDFVVPILDISLVRVVVENKDAASVFETDTPMALEFQLDRHRFQVQGAVRARGEGWVRLDFERVVPSSQAHLRSFLSAKRIGESIREHEKLDELRHFHGLNESELWFHPDIGILFTYLDSHDPTAQFILRILNTDGNLKVGKILRADYIEMQSIEAELSLLPLTDRDTYAKLGECRDIVTNFRPSGQIEYGLKQRLLKVISGHLYSTGSRFETPPLRNPVTVRSM